MAPERVGAATGWLLNAALIGYVLLHWDEKSSDALRVGAPIILILLLMWYFLDKKLDRALRATAELRDQVDRR